MSVSRPTVVGDPPDDMDAGEGGMREAGQGKSVAVTGDVAVALAAFDQRTECLDEVVEVSSGEGGDVRLRRADLDRGVDGEAPPVVRARQLGVDSVEQEGLDDRADGALASQPRGLVHARPLGIAAQRLLVEVALAGERVVEAAASQPRALAQVLGRGRAVAARPECVHRRLDGGVRVELPGPGHASRLYQSSELTHPKCTLP
jgi:hypothetical protein